MRPPPRRFILPDIRTLESPLLLLVWGFAAGFWLWATGADVALQHALYGAYNQNFNTLTRAVGWLALGRNQIWALVALTAACAVYAYLKKQPYTLAKTVALALPMLAAAGLLQLIAKNSSRPPPAQRKFYGTAPTPTHSTPLHSIAASGASPAATPPAPLP